MLKFNDLKIGIIGLGYVGLPLAVEFSKHFQVLGYDKNKNKINNLKSGIDDTNELISEEITLLKKIELSCNSEDLIKCNCYIMTVPTPVDANNKPDLSYLIDASSIVGKALSKGDVVIYESTVYPGATEEDCAPILSKYSGLSIARDDQIDNKDIFYLGYSPERINPGDKKHRLTDIIKITSGSSNEASLFIDGLYKKVIKAGTYRAPNIKTAEAAKVIENTQRDVNIALINELSIIFDKIGLDTNDVLTAAATKWNFLSFKPGLVGGHCIGVDPYYLTHKALKSGYNPEMILAGRKINNYMSEHISLKIIQLMLEYGIENLNAKILVMGATFKENCPDMRNSKVFDLVKSLLNNRCKVDIYDPWIDLNNLANDYNFISKPNNNEYDVIVIAVGHQKFKELGVDEIREFGKNKHVLFDIKSIFEKEKTDGRL